MIRHVEILSPRQLADIRAYLENQRQYTRQIANLGHPVKPGGESGIEVTSYQYDVMAQCPHVWSLVQKHTPFARDYLGPDDGCFVYSINAFWSRPGDRENTYGLKTAHVDKDDRKFLTLFIYLTDVLDDGHGPFVMDDRPVYGKAGTAFFADTRLPHYGMMPTAGNRLMLWIRWGVSDPPKTYKNDAIRPIQRHRITEKIPETPEFRNLTHLLIDWREQPDLKDRPWKFSLWNHSNGAEGLRDIIEPVMGAMSALGYDVSRDDTIQHSGNYEPFHVYVECFSKRQAAEVLQAVDDGLDFGLICTEWFDGETMAGTKGDRSREFLRLAAHARFIWSVIPQDEYARCGVPYAHMPIGYEPDCFRAQTAEPEFDLCCYGQLTPEREEVRRFLDDHGISYNWLPFGLSKELRDIEIGRCRYVLGLPATGKTGGFSVTRMSAALHAGRPLIAWRPDDIKQMPLHRMAWNIHRQQQIDWFKANTSMRDTMKRVLGETT